MIVYTFLSLCIHMSPVSFLPVSFLMRLSTWHEFKDQISGCVPSGPSWVSSQACNGVAPIFLQA